MRRPTPAPSARGDSSHDLFMDIHFCDLCNESVPESDFAIGRAIRHKGRVVCARCDAAMAGHDHGTGAAGSTHGYGTMGAATQSGAATAVASRSSSAAGPARAHGHEHHPSTARSRASSTHEPAAHPADEEVRPGRGWPGILGLMAGTAALAAIGVGGVLMLERLDRLEAATRGAHAAVERTSTALRSERTAALAPFEENLVEAEQRAARAMDEAMKVVNGRLDQLEALLVSAGERETKLRDGMTELRASLSLIDEDVDDLREKRGDAIQKLDNLVQFHGDRIIELEERIREAGALVASGGVPGAAGASGGAAPTAAAWEPLLADLKNADPGVRLDAAYALEQTGDPDVVPHITPLMEDEDRFVRLVAVQALENLGARIAVPGIIERLSDETVMVREAAMLALRSLTGQKFGFEPDARQKDRKKKVDDWKAWWSRNGDDFLTGG